MRIFYASDTTPNSAFQSNIWRNNLYLPLVDLGHDVVEFQYDLRKTFQNLDPAHPRKRAFIHKNRPKLTKELLHQVRKAYAVEPIDLFFSYFYDACVLPEAIDEIKSMKFDSSSAVFLFVIATSVLSSESSPDVNSFITSLFKTLLVISGR